MGVSERNIYLMPLNLEPIGLCQIENSEQIEGQTGQPAHGRIRRGALRNDHGPEGVQSALASGGHLPEDGVGTGPLEALLTGSCGDGKSLAFRRLMRWLPALKFGVMNAEISPGGHWIACDSSESGSQEV